MDRYRVLALCVTLAAGCPLGPVAASWGGAPASKGDAKNGKEVFQQCSVCHNAGNDEKKMGPGLKGLFKKAKLTDGKKPTEAGIRSKIDGGGNGMPAYKDMLSDVEKDDLIAYLKTL